MLKYEAIASRLREDIQKGTYEPGQLIDRLAELEIFDTWI